MIPGAALSTLVAEGDFLPPRNRRKQPLEDYELGGVALNDASQGLQFYEWRGRYIDGSVVLDVPGVVAPVTVLTVPGVTEFSFSFDQNMSPVVAYMLGDGSAHFYWFDSTIPGFTTLDLGSGARSPRCSLDDKRAVSGVASGASDVILTYLRDDALYFRAQRDRYATEYKLELPPAFANFNLSRWKLGQFGMGNGLRMLWQLVPDV